MNDTAQIKKWNLIWNTNSFVSTFFISRVGVGGTSWNFWGWFFATRGCERFMDVNADLRQLSSAELLLLLHNIWVELHNRLNFQPAASTNPEPENPGFTEESFVPHSCDQYCDWCRRWCTRHKAGHRHHTCFEHRHKRGWVRNSLRRLMKLTM